LRVGIIAKRYCGALVLPERRALRRLAVSQAAQMLATIARDGAKRVGGAFWSASKARMGDAARGFGESVRQAVRALAQWVGSSAGEAVEVAELPSETGSDGSLWRD
ncbi:MAG: hypothetical protein H6Q87_1850, partial [candidate division NC10 bacterium]|nr:hypothetical protein [candidate division NC10 bacterium]